MIPQRIAFRHLQFATLQWNALLSRVFGALHQRGKLVAKVDRESAILIGGLHAVFEGMGISPDVKRLVLTREWTLSEIPPIASDAECANYQRRRDACARPDPHSGFAAWAIWFKTPAGIRACAFDARIIEWLQGRGERRLGDVLTDPASGAYP